MRQKIRVCGINSLIFVFDFLVIPLAVVLGVVLGLILSIYISKLSAFVFFGVFTFFFFTDHYTLLESLQIFWWDLLSGGVICLVFCFTTWLWHKFSHGTKKEAAPQILEPVSINIEDEVELNKI
jgi:hypothetical protein